MQSLQLIMSIYAHDRNLGERRKMEKINKHEEQSSDFVDNKISDSMPPNGSDFILKLDMATITKLLRKIQVIKPIILNKDDNNTITLANIDVDLIDPLVLNCIFCLRDGKISGINIAKSKLHVSINLNKLEEMTGSKQSNNFIFKIKCKDSGIVTEVLYNSNPSNISNDKIGNAVNSLIFDALNKEYIFETTLLESFLPKQIFIQRSMYVKKNFMILKIRMCDSRYEFTNEDKSYMPGAQEKECICINPCYLTRNYVIPLMKEKYGVDPTKWKSYRNSPLNIEGIYLKIASGWAEYKIGIITVRGTYEVFLKKLNMYNNNVLELDCDLKTNDLKVGDGFINVRISYPEYIYNTIQSNGYEDIKVEYNAGAMSVKVYDQSAKFYPITETIEGSIKNTLSNSKFSIDIIYDYVFNHMKIGSSFIDVEL